MTGRVTMLGISRWTEAGGSYRTVQRFYAKTLPWAAISWLFVRHHLLQTDHEYVLAGDLEDFMNVKQTPLTTAVNLSFFMVNFSYCLLHQLRQDDPDAGSLDLKTLFRGRRYAIETLTLLPEPPTSFISSQIVHMVATLGRIHRQFAALKT
jgi:hypothetical protein